MSLTISGKLSLPTGQAAANALIRFRAVNSVDEIIEGAESTARCDSTGNYNITIGYCRYELSTKISTVDFIVHGIVEISSSTVASDLEDLIALISLTEIADSDAAAEIIKKMQELKSAAEQAAKNASTSATEAKGYRDETLSAKTSVEATAADVTSKAAQVSTDAAQVASDKADVEINKNLVYDDKVAVEGYKTEIENIKTETQSFRDEASSFSTKAETSANNASTSESNALASAIRAEKAAETASSGVIDRGKWDASTGLFPTPTMNPETTDWYRISVAGTMTGSGNQETITAAEGDNLYWDKVDDVWYKIGSPDLADITPESIGAANKVHNHSMSDISDADSYIGARYVKLSSPSNQVIGSSVEVRGTLKTTGYLGLGLKPSSGVPTEGFLTYDRVRNEVVFSSDDPKTGYKSWKSVSSPNVAEVLTIGSDKLMSAGSSSVRSDFGYMWVNTVDIDTERVFTLYAPSIYGFLNNFIAFGDVTGTCSKQNPLKIKPYNSAVKINGKSEPFVITEPYRFVTVSKYSDSEWIITHDTGRNEYSLPTYASGCFNRITATEYDNILVPSKTIMDSNNVAFSYEEDPLIYKNILVNEDGLYKVSFNANVKVLGAALRDKASFRIRSYITGKTPGETLRQAEVIGEGTHSLSMDAIVYMKANDGISFTALLQNSLLIGGDTPETSFSIYKIN